MAFLELAHLDKSFSANHVVKDFNLSIEKGEFVSLLGPSGCGKTTVLRMVGGFEVPSAGSIHIDGQDVTSLKSNQRNIGMVFQAYALFPNLTVAQNVGFGLKVKGAPAREIAARVAEMLALIGLPEMGERYPYQLSGGQQQRVALARALAPKPQVLLLDEPLSALDLQLRKEMQIELKRLQVETGITFVFVTHDQEEALTMSDRIGVMQAGHLLQVGDPRTIYTRPANRFVASFIGESNFLTGTVDGRTFTLDAGPRMEVAPGDAAPASGKVTAAIRPEQIRITSATLGDGIPATVTQTVYFGTDTHCRVALKDGTEITVRLQSPASGDVGLHPGSEVTLKFEPGALIILPEAA